MPNKETTVKLTSETKRQIDNTCHSCQRIIFTEKQKIKRDTKMRIHLHVYQTTLIMFTFLGYL